MDLNVFLEDVFYLLIITDSVTGILLFLPLLSILKKRAVHYYDQAICLRNKSAAPNHSSTTLEKNVSKNRTFFSSGNKQTRNTEIYEIYCPLSTCPNLCSVPLRCQNQFVFTYPAEDLSRPTFYRFLAQFVPSINLMAIWNNTIKYLKIKEIESRKGYEPNLGKPLNL